MATDKFVTKEQLSEILNSVNNFKNVPETVVGKWVDGKLIYQTVIEKEISTYTDSGIRRDFNVAEIFGVDSIVSVEGYVKVIGGSETTFIGTTFLLSGVAWGNMVTYPYVYFCGTTSGVEPSNHRLYIISRWNTQTTWGVNKIKAYAIIRYTKA